MTKRRTGTREWAEREVNCQHGCEYDCRYCYAADMADRFKRIAREDWHIPRIREKAVAQGRRFVRGTIMFPTTHDITPANRGACLEVLVKLLAAGNKVLLVTKAHARLMQYLRDHLDPHHLWEQLELRFTIGAAGEEGEKRAAYWEPGAPAPRVRMHELYQAWDDGFRTSVSIEPCLSLPNVAELVEDVEVYVTETIWIGLMRDIRRRVRIVTAEDERRVREIEAEQSVENVRRVYEQLKSHPKVRWKDSVRQLLGIEGSRHQGIEGGKKK